MPNKFEKLVEEAPSLTDEQFKVRFSSLTRFNDEDTLKIIKDTGISKEDLALLLVEVKNAGEITNKTVHSISNIQGGVQALVAITKKMLL